MLPKAITPALRMAPLRKYRKRKSTSRVRVSSSFKASGLGFRLSHSLEAGTDSSNKVQRDAN